MASLSKEEARQLCERVAAYRKATAELPGFHKIRCGTDALGAAGARENTTPEAMRTSCTKELERCLASPPTIPEIDCTSSAGSGLVPGFMDQLARCPALTVDELFACTEEMRSMLTAIAQQDPCAMAFDPADTLASYNGYIRKLKGPHCAVMDERCKRTR
ncbi:MAG TPA: hypothetical protein VFV99_32650 [Kofleriaceae bacterium]|nr:hypothetical protein [Kofleriaceae bacterium]